MLYQSTSVGLGYGLCAGAVSWKPLARPPNPIRGDKPRPSSRPGRLGNINPIPIGYGFRPRLRDRLTLRGLTLRRNPWTFGVRGSHPHLRYSCQHSHFRYLQRPSRDAFTGLRNAPLPLQKTVIRNQLSERLAWRPESIRAISRYSPRQRSAASPPI